jgi:CheY-like chemotaxis protein
VKEGKVLNILLINDDEDDSFILHEVSHYFSDKLVLHNTFPTDDVVEKIAAGPHHDLLLLDLYMPKINGLDLLKKIRSNSRLKNTPVIIYSSRQHSTIVRKCFEAGATLFVEKPHTYKGIERMLKKILAMDWEKYNVKTKDLSFILETEDY